MIMLFVLYQSILIIIHSYLKTCIEYAKVKVLSDLVVVWGPTKSEFLIASAPVWLILWVLDVVVKVGTNRYCLLGSEHSAVQLDVSSTTQVSQVIETVISRYAAPPTVLVNSAGITRDAFLLKMTLDQFTQVLDVNIKVLGYIVCYITLGIDIIDYQVREMCKKYLL